MDFWKIAMRPGKPLIHGHVDNIPLLGLPGNPVSSAVCAMVFLRPALAKLSGHDDQPVTIAARLLGNLPENDKRQDYLRATLTHDENGMPEVRPFPRQDSSMIGVFAAANALVVRPPFDAPLHDGDMVQVMPLDPRL
jgi:molybdopterin molybdotransferase